MKHFSKKVRKDSCKAMFDYLHEHYTYSTMNSWNRLESIANNVKIYNLPFQHSQDQIFEALEENAGYEAINSYIQDWEINHPGYSVGFNGRSGGYLVLYCDKGMDNALIKTFDCCPCNYDNYDDWRSDVIYYYSYLKNYKKTLIEQVELVQDFDRLCDDLIELLDLLAEELIIEKEHTKEFTALKCSEIYEYDSEENARLHELYMNNLRYEVVAHKQAGSKIYKTFAFGKEIKDTVVDF